MEVQYTTLTCIVCGEKSTLFVDSDDLARWQNGAHIQDVWPDKPAAWREQLMTGTHGHCFDEIFKEFDEIFDRIQDAPEN
jgi:hypothetical protein